jgi:AP2-like factor, ANT lineage
LAAEAYDVAAIKFRGLNAVTNFDITRYDVEKIMESNTLLPSEFVRRNKDGDNAGTAAITTVEDAAAALVHAGNNAIEWKIQQAAARTDEHVQQNHELLASDAFSVLNDMVSLATSVSNSREQSPDRGGGLAMFFAKPGSKLTCPPLPLGSWVSPSPVSIAHLPMFAAWTDAA